MVDCAAGSACTAAPIPLPSRGMEASSVLFAPSMTSVAETLPAASGAKFKVTGQLVWAAYGGSNWVDKQVLLAPALTVKSGVLLPASSTSIFAGVVLALKVKVTCSEAGVAPDRKSGVLGKSGELRG